MPFTIAVVNQKGGVAKTTTTEHLSWSLSQRGQRVLSVDFDPQANLTVMLGHNPVQLEREGKSAYRLLNDASLAELIIPGEFDLVPSSIKLESAAFDAIRDPHVSTPHLLRDALREVGDRYDFVLIDCPPSLSLLTVNALAAANTVLIPCKTDLLSMYGIPLLFQSIARTKQRNNRSLQVLGVLPTMYSARFRHDQEALQELQRVMEEQGVDVFEPVPRTTAFDQANEQRQPLGAIDATNPGAVRYDELADYIINHAGVYAA